MRLRTYVLLATVGLAPVAGCGSEGSSEAPAPTPGADSGIDAADDALPDTAVSDTAVPDSALPDTAVPDTELPDTEVPDSTLPDSAIDGSQPDATEEASIDAAPDQGTDSATSNRPPGQCKQDSDCGGGQTCTMTAPGGLCAGCGTENDCPDPLAFECFVGTCQRTCSDDPDCPEGYECKSVGRCGLIACSASCPAPYVCDGGYCRRPTCSSTPPACPTGMTCGQDDVCVEE